MSANDSSATRKIRNYQRAEATHEARKIEAGLLMACGVPEDDMEADRDYGESGVSSRSPPEQFAQ
jgi:hypothetical protein